ncbi:flagellar biosynthetic protein FliR [Desulfohalobiaceae bacterium Ax17]|jgi:flagellar biosynthetic protein FliR|uniref:flagellar biosynthetic protein FliR n=1 Tax=Desulfovulcanus ferrireducens TaxID=2831190 RepID=UPI00207BC05B|nr:flagellar biosynthetic protein FliR [Desulfovulcanus ferrireducens]MBT8764398.1 flagellar biosynthetic protein FliR [Desulfovulcanus ferrireducens]
MDLFNFDPTTFLSFFLTLFRISLVLFLLPFFGGESLPNPVKAAVCLVLTLGLWPSLSFPADYFPVHPFGIAVMLLGELILGLILGLVVRFLFAAIQTGGQLIGFQMGFAMINVVDPITGVSEAVTAHFLYMTSLLTFLSLNGHLFLLKGLAQTFELVPPGGLLITPQLVNQIFLFSGQIFVLAIKIAAPVMTAIFLVDLALALISRAAPQMNVLFVGFPLKIGVGFLFLGLLFKIMSVYLSDFVHNLGTYFGQLLKAM